MTLEVEALRVRILENQRITDSPVDELAISKYSDISDGEQVVVDGILWDNNESIIIGASMIREFGSRVYWDFRDFEHRRLPEGGREVTFERFPVSEDSMKGAFCGWERTRQERIIASLLSENRTYYYPFGRGFRYDSDSSSIKGE